MAAITAAKVPPAGCICIGCRPDPSPKCARCSLSSSARLKRERLGFTALHKLEEAPLLISLSGTYAVEGDTLRITSAAVDDEGNETMETVVFRRTDAASAVVQTTWGSLKSGLYLKSSL